MKSSGIRTVLALAAVAVAALVLAPASANAATIYWDIDGATPGAGGATPGGTWSTGGATWSTNPNGTVATPGVTTSLADDLVFSAGVNATGAYTITLNDAQDANSLTFQDGTATISGTGGIINFGASGSGVIRVSNSLTGTPLTATIGDNTDTVIGGSVGLTKTGVGTLTLNGSAVNTFTGGLKVNGGTLAMDYANLATPTDLIKNTNAMSFGGGNLTIKGLTGANDTTKTLGNVTVNSGGGSVLINPNGGTSTTLTLGTLTATAKGGSLTLGKALSAGAGTVAITTTTDKDAQGIYGGRVVFANGTANTGYDWATSTGAGPYTLSAYSGYSAMATSGTDTLNSRITASTTLTGNLTTNSLKFENPLTAQTLNLGTSTLTLTSGGLLITGSSVAQGPIISNGSITAGNDSGSYDLVVHQYNATLQMARGVSGTNLVKNTTISANIVNNDGNSVTLVKAGTGSLLLSGTGNTFTGGIVVNGGTLALNHANALNNNNITFNANSTLYTATMSSTGGITLNNGSQVLILNNNGSFTVSGAVTGDGGISVAQGGQGSITVNLNSTANTFTGPIRYEHSQPNQSAHVTVGSLVDTDTYGTGNITFGLPGNATNSSHNFNYGSTAIAPLVLNNRRFELAGSALIAQSINNNSSQAVTINTDVLSSGTGTKTLTLGGTGAGLSTFAGDIGLGSITTLNITKSGTGTWVLSGDNSYNGATTLTAGTLSVGANANLGGANSLIFNGGTLQVTGTTLGDFGTHTTTFNAAKTVGLDIADVGNTFTVSQVMSQTTGGLTKAGLGTLVLTNANTYTGVTTVNAGTLLVNGSLAATAGKVTVNANGTLGGTGTMASDVDVFGTLAPGAGIESLDTGDLLIAATGTLDIELGRAGVTRVSDIVNVTGAVTLTAGANLKLTLYSGLNNPQLNDVFYLVANDDTDVVTGVFTKLDGADAALDEDSTFTWNSQSWKITYTADAGIAFVGGNDIAIKVVPEPATMGLLAIGGLIMLGRRRRS